MRAQFEEDGEMIQIQVAFYCVTALMGRDDRHPRYRLKIVIAVKHTACVQRVGEPEGDHQQRIKFFNRIDCAASWLYVSVISYSNVIWNEENIRRFEKRFALQKHVCLELVQEICRFFSTEFEL